MVKRSVLIGAVVVIAVAAIAGFYLGFTYLVPQRRAITLDLREWAFNGLGYTNIQGGPVIRVKAGETIQVTVNNVGTMDHEFMVISKSDLEDLLKREITPGEEVHVSVIFEGADVDVEPGESKTITFTVSNPGEYVYACLETTPTLHAKNGMWGTFIVEP